MMAAGGSVVLIVLGYKVTNIIVYIAIVFCIMVMGDAESRMVTLRMRAFATLSKVGRNVSQLGVNIVWVCNCL